MDAGKNFSLRIAARLLEIGLDFNVILMCYRISFMIIHFN